MTEQSTPNQYDLIMYEAERRCERLKQLAVLEEALPSRKAKDSEMARLWTIVNEAHGLLTGYDLLPSPPPMAEVAVTVFEAGVMQLHAIVSKSAKG